MEKPVIQYQLDTSKAECNRLKFHQHYNAQVDAAGDEFKISSASTVMYFLTQATAVPSIRLSVNELRRITHLLNRNCLSLDVCRSTANGRTVFWKVALCIINSLLSCIFLYATIYVYGSAWWIVLDFNSYDILMYLWVSGIAMGGIWTMSHFIDGSQSISPTPNQESNSHNLQCGLTKTRAFCGLDGCPTMVCMHRL